MIIFDSRSICFNTIPSQQNKVLRYHNNVQYIYHSLNNLFDILYFKITLINFICEFDISVLISFIKVTKLSNRARLRTD